MALLLDLETFKCSPARILKCIAEVPMYCKNFDNDQSCTKFLEKLNTQHPNIKFTLEQAKNTIPFLDVEIKIDLDKFDTWTWRKPSNTKLLLNFNAFLSQILGKKVLVCVFSIEQKLSVQRTISSKNKLLI